MMAQGGGVRYGCYIQDTAGKLWKAGTWDGSATFNGIAVHTEECSFVTKSGTGSNGYLCDTMAEISSTYPEYSTEALAKVDYDGEGNTALLNSKYSTAKQYVEHNPFPDGTIGYIPSLGELYTLYEHKDEVYALYEEATGGTMTDAVYRSSTLKDGAGSLGTASLFWVIDFGDGGISSYRASNTKKGYIRSFCKLNI